MWQTKGNLNLGYCDVIADIKFTTQIGNAAFLDFKENSSRNVIWKIIYNGHKTFTAENWTEKNQL